jgi:serine/threonine protein kinase/TPR repeat protein
MPEAITFEHYEVQVRDDGSLHELGRGAMGITYKAFDTNLRVPVALKVINAQYLDSELARQRFVREARSAAKLRHRNVATVYHLGTETDTWFYAMEYIEGETLDALIKRQGPLHPLLALQIVDQVARALNAAQRHELVHRDIKPANLMLVREDDDLVVKVIDFGLAKSSAGAGAEDAATVSMGGFVGTPHFASPEQLEEREIDVRSDIYSLGITLWYMLTGQTPFAGSMAQVMSQHLSKPPPFEQFANLPPPLATLLQRMLEKDPAARQQTPTELRMEIEACIGQLADGATTIAGAVQDEENFATLLEDVSGRAAESAWETGATIAARYRITETRGETNAGKIFRAHDAQLGRDVRLLRLRPELLQAPGAATQIEREIERLAPVQHANLLHIQGFETIEGTSYLAMEWTEGFSLLELLRARRELAAREVLPILAQAAAGADAALAAGLRRVEFALHEIRLHFAQAFDKPTLLRHPVGAWPPFLVKLNPLGIAQELSQSQTWAGGETMVGGHARGGAGEERDPRTATVRALGSVVYELLGGSVPPGGVATVRGYTPLATLSEEGNAVLKRALDPATSFPSAEAFHRALAEIAVLDVKRGGPGAPAPAPAKPRPVVPAPLPPTHSRKVPVAFFGGVATVLMIGTAVWFFARPGPPERSETPPPSRDRVAVATPVPSAPEATPPPQSVAIVTPPKTEATPALKGADTIVPPMPAPPTPTRAELLKAAMERGAKLEADERWPEALTTYLQNLRDYPESESPRVNLELMLGRLIKMPKGLPPEAYAAMKDDLHAAAGLDVVAAMALLADSLRERDRVAAFNWMAAAAERGNVHALTQTGLMLAGGRGTPVDQPRAIIYFTDAAEKGDPAAMAALGECYLLGNGVEKNGELAVKWLTQAAELGNAWGKNELGVCYHKGIGVNRDPARAFQLFTDAAALGFTRANLNLGALYMNGEGVKQDETKGASYFQKAAQGGDVNGMYTLAQVLLEGTGIEKSRTQASAWMKKAAEAGHKGAQQWCRENRVSFTEAAR